MIKVMCCSATLSVEQIRRLAEITAKLPSGTQVEFEVKDMKRSGNHIMEDWGPGSIELLAVYPLEVA